MGCARLPRDPVCDGPLRDLRLPRESGNQYESAEVASLPERVESIW